MLVREFMQTEVVTIQAGQTVPDAVVKMATLEARRLLVTEEGRLVGLLTAGAVTRTLQKSSGPQTPWGIVFQAAFTQVRDIMTTEVFAVQETDDLPSAIASLLEHHVGGLPVLDEGGLLSGILTLTDVLRAAVVQGPQPGWGQVRDQMSTSVLSVTPETPLSEAAARMTVTRTRVMPVTARLTAPDPVRTATTPGLQGEAGHGTRNAASEGRALLGVLHLRDIRAAITHAEDGHGPTVMGDRYFLGGQTVRDMMRSPSATIHPDTALIGAVVAMQRADVNGLPVVGDDGGLLGVITVSDVLRAMLGVSPPVPDHGAALV